MNSDQLLDFIRTRRGKGQRAAVIAMEEMISENKQLSMALHKARDERDTLRQGFNSAKRELDKKETDRKKLRDKLSRLGQEKDRAEKMADGMVPAESLDAANQQVDQLKDLVARYAEAAEQQKAEAVRELTAHGYYRDQLAQAHTLIGRIVHQFAQTGWDAVRLSDFFPTDNPGGVRGPLNPGGDNE